MANVNNECQFLCHVLYIFHLQTMTESTRKILEFFSSKRVYTNAHAPSVQFVVYLLQTYLYDV